MAVPTPHEVIILRPGTDAYGNPASSFDNPTAIPVRGFHVSKLSGSVREREDLVLFPAGTDIRIGDRVQVNGETYAVDGQTVPVRSPAAEVMVYCRVSRVEA